jgi:hypothetical protein
MREWRTKSVREMGKHKKKKVVAVEPSQQQQEQLTAEQKNEQELNELLQIYSPERREAMREKILQRNKKKKK